MGEAWEENVVSQTQEAYQEIDLTARDRVNRRILGLPRKKKLVDLEPDIPELYQSYINFQSSHLLLCLCNFHEY